GGEIGIAIYNRVNVTVHNCKIMENLYGINVAFSNHQKIFGNKFLNNTFIGIGLSNSTKITVENNAFRDNGNGMALFFSNETVIYRNNFVNNTAKGIMLMDTAYSTIINNVIGKSPYGIALINSSNNNILKNHITRNKLGVLFQNSSSNIIYHNNFIANEIQAYDSARDWPKTPLSVNIWDDGYPSGGNFWDDYEGKDEKSGPYQNITGSDGIGDTPYVIDENNVDRYPLMNPLPPSVVMVVPDDYPTIQAAINAALSGSIIFVKSGIYFEEIYVFKPVVWLIGENRETTIIDGQGQIGGAYR
ncbi:MAG: NosD domain-containing protein, partial [Candidatus Bathyarchaeia archaeon]